MWAAGRGTLAIMAKRQVGPMGAVYGIVASPGIGEMEFKHC